jgi:hypothetical protein
MGVTKVARRLRSSRKPTAKLAVMGVTAATAAAVALGSATPAAALDVNQEVYTAGRLVNLLPALGLDTIPVPLGVLPVVGDTTLILHLDPIEYDTPNIYNTVNALPFLKRGIFSTVYDRVLGAPADPTGQFPAVLGSGIGTLNTINAYRAQISSVQGATPNGFTPYQQVPGSSVSQTNQALLYLRNPLRPNGGIGPRFASIFDLFGANPTLPAAGVNTGTGLALNTATLDVTWAYDLFSDFPVTLNPFSLVNSLLTVLPVNLAGGVSLQALDLTAAGVNIAGTLGILNRLTGGIAGISDGQAWYGTLLPNDLPILEPLRFPSRLINGIFGTSLGTPLADALQPAAKILVNIGYSDVVTPDDIKADPTLADTYQPYDRTFLTSATPVPFLSVNPLTPPEWLQVPGDVVRALIGGFVSVLAPGLAPPVATAPSARAVAAATEPPAADSETTVAVASPRKARDASVRARQSSGGARAVSQIKAADAPKRAAAARSAARASD